MRICAMPSRQELANAIRVLSMDAVQAANSGHPGMPLGMADIAEVLWNDFLVHNPNNPTWANRDRFVVSNGHGSMLLYSLLHLSGYNLPIEELRQFRQLHSKTPGHPEYGITPGVETTTGPLGQGIANAVGMAVAEAALAAQFNQDDLKIIDHYTYAFLGDGCLMEGISHEVCSLAGTLGLGKLIAFWDDNGISIDGHTSGWFTDDTIKRFEAYGWHVVADVDGHNATQIHAAIMAAREVQPKPSLICCRTTIGFGAPNAAGTHNCHGAPLGVEEITATRKALDWQDEPFIIPTAIYEAWSAQDAGSKRESDWQQCWDRYAAKYPDLANELTRRLTGQLPDNYLNEFNTFLNRCLDQQQNIATRKASLEFLNALAPSLPEFIGGSADLSGSNLTNWQGCKILDASTPGGNYIHYGVREFGMSAIMNGIALHGGFIPFGGTFLTFYDYAKNAVRMAALMQQRVIFIYTHDSIGLGEDGPTHQPVEQAASMRMTPGIEVWRPCDTVETAIAWQMALTNHDKPTSLLLSRQSLPFQHRSDEQVANISKGGYVLRDCEGTPDLILIATGSEVALAVQTAEKLSSVAIRVVSMPCCERFLAQPRHYREHILPAEVTARIAIEASAPEYWYQFVGLAGRVVGLNRFGESAPDKVVFQTLGFTVENIVSIANELLTEGVTV